MAISDLLYPKAFAAPTFVLGDLTTHSSRNYEVFRLHLLPPWHTKFALNFTHPQLLASFAWLTILSLPYMSQPLLAAPGSPFSPAIFIICISSSDFWCKHLHLLWTDTSTSAALVSLFLIRMWLWSLGFRYATRRLSYPLCISLS